MKFDVCHFDKELKLSDFHPIQGLLLAKEPIPVAVVSFKCIFQGYSDPNSNNKIYGADVVALGSVNESNMVFRRRYISHLEVKARSKDLKVSKDKHTHHIFSYSAFYDILHKIDEEVPFSVYFKDADLHSNSPDRLGFDMVTYKNAERVMQLQEDIIAASKTSVGNAVEIKDLTQLRLAAPVHVGNIDNDLFDKPTVDRVESFVDQKLRTLNRLARHYR